ncbi:hypothetical protein ACHAXT_010844 [Thalassiosira profunda]
MGIIASKHKAAKDEQLERLEAMLGPPSKTMDASNHVQELVMYVSKTLESHLDVLPVPGKRRDLQATQMITRSVRGSGNGENDGIMYYVKVKTHVAKWPWAFVKIHEPPAVTSVSNVQFWGMKKMKEEYKLVTF